MTLFEDETHFDGELALYEDNQVNNTWLMPALRALHPAPSAVQRGSRHSASVPLPVALPPAIVTVCGFTLDAWVPLSIAPAEQPKFYEVMDVRPECACRSCLIYARFQVAQASVKGTAMRTLQRLGWSAVVFAQR